MSSVLKSRSLLMATVAAMMQSVIEAYFFGALVTFTGGYFVGAIQAARVSN